MAELAGQEVSVELLEVDNDNGGPRPAQRIVVLSHNYVCLSPASLHFVTHLLFVKRKTIFFPMAMKFKFLTLLNCQCMKIQSTHGSGGITCFLFTQIFICL